MSTFPAASATLPPGPTGEPGAVMRRLFTDALGAIEDWHEEFGDIFSVPLPFGPLVIVCEPEAANRLLVKHVSHGPIHGRTEAAQGRGITVLDGEEWKRTRALMRPMFTRGRLDALAELIVAALDSGMQELEPLAESGESFDGSAFWGRVTLRALLRSLFGDSVGDEEIESLAHDYGEVNKYKAGLMASAFERNGRVAHEEEGKAAVARTDEVVYRVIAERRARRDDRADMLDLLLQARYEDDGTGLSDKELRDEVTTLFFAGFETTKWAVSWTLAFLGREPQALDRAVTAADRLGGRLPTASDLPELDYLRACMDEGMRIQGMPFLPRQLSSDETLVGYDLPEGTVAGVAVRVLHHRPDLWGDPERYDPDRFLGERRAAQRKGQFTPFGAGPRVCLGMNFAYMQGQFILAMFLARYRFVLADGFEPVPKYEYNVVLRDGLPLSVERRS